MRTITAATKYRANIRAARPTWVRFVLQENSTLFGPLGLIFAISAPKVLNFVQYYFDSNFTTLSAIKTARLFRFKIFILAALGVKFLIAFFN